MVRMVYFTRTCTDATPSSFPESNPRGGVRDSQEYTRSYEGADPRQYRFLARNGIPRRVHYWVARRPPGKTSRAFLLIPLSLCLLPLFISTFQPPAVGLEKFEVEPAASPSPSQGGGGGGGGHSSLEPGGRRPPWLPPPSPPPSPSPSPSPASSSSSTPVASPWGAFFSAQTAARIGLPVPIPAASRVDSAAAGAAVGAAVAAAAPPDALAETPPKIARGLRRFRPRVFVVNPRDAEEVSLRADPRSDSAEVCLMYHQSCSGGCVFCCACCRSCQPAWYLEWFPGVLFSVSWAQCSAVRRDADGFEPGKRKQWCARPVVGGVLLRAGVTFFVLVVCSGRCALSE